MTESSKSDTIVSNSKQASKARHKADVAAREVAKQARLKAALRDNLRRRKLTATED
jgi:hypothetical protein